MQIGPNCMVTLGQRLTMLDGSLLDDGKQHVQYLHGGYQQLFDKLEQALDGKQVGDQISVRLEPKDGFGEYDDSLVIAGSLDQFEKAPSVGDIIEKAFDGGDTVYRVVEIKDDQLILDGNHPFAGLTLDFQATVLEVRPATEEEVISQSGRVSVDISRWRALKMAGSCFIGIPVFLILALGGLTSWLGDGALLTIAMLLGLVILLYGLWMGCLYTRDLIKGGEALRVDGKGIFWRKFGAPVAWGDVAKLAFHSAGSESWYDVTLADQRSFRVDATVLSVDPAQLSRLFALYLPKEKLAGI